MSSESPKTIFSVFIMFDSVLSQSCSSDTALSNLGHGDAFSETTNITLCEKGLEVFSEMFDMSSRYWGFRKTDTIYLSSNFKDAFLCTLRY